MFIHGNIYKRTKLHDEHGGNRQRGISPCSKNPLIFIFSSKEGKQHGYDDHWGEDGFYYYTGEGQEGDMKFTYGNKALIDHVKDDRSIYLFETTPEGRKFIDELELVDYFFKQIPDKNGDIRRGIIFKLKSLKGEIEDEKGKPRLAEDYNKPNNTERKGLVTSRVGQGWFRKQLLEKWGNKCAVTGSNLTQILIASHIVPWGKGTDQERLDIENGIILSPIYDALFDRNLISFSDKGKIMLSEKLNDIDLNCFGITKNETIDVTEGMKKYLKRHRELCKI